MGAGYLININDIAGPYSGIIFGISNTMATLTGIISPYVASNITKHVCLFCYDYTFFTIFINEILSRATKANGRKFLSLQQ